MPISLDALAHASRRVAPQVLAKSMTEAVARAQRTAFLSHSHLDRDLAKGLQTLLSEQGWDLFIDWEHNQLYERPTRETAKWLQRQIVACDWLLYLATPNSERSRWCPWEIGYADGKKAAHSIVVVATQDSNGIYGSEYLDIYRQISEAFGGGLALFEAGRPQAGRYLRETSTQP